MARPLTGSGLGLRRDLTGALKNYQGKDIDFFEVAPENWIDAGGRYQRELRTFTDKYPLVCHGLSLSIGSADPLDFELLKKIKTFMKDHGAATYTEHLSWCSYNGHLYDLLPIPSNDDNVRWIAERIRQVQDVLEMPIGLENASYYFAPPTSSMPENEFIRAIVEESGCFLHLDVNNVYVNSKNFNFDPIAYLTGLPLAKTGYIHVAGHFVEDDGVIIDTHGADVIDPVWDLLQSALRLIGSNSHQIPICLERDFNFPDLNELLTEVRTIKNIQQKHLAEQVHGTAASNAAASMRA